MHRSPKVLPDQKVNPHGQSCGLCSDPSYFGIEKRVLEEHKTEPAGMHWASHPFE